MSYQKIIKTVARKYNTTVGEVDKEIRLAIKSAGLQMEPEGFIEMVRTIIKIDRCKKADM
ncbi:MAG: hypothetical protein K2G60_03870 [Oscillospiraceae bacterium]|nr:hypothetical protein [Oscillospiraceae bacterium]